MKKLAVTLLVIASATAYAQTPEADSTGHRTAGETNETREGSHEGEPAGTKACPGDLEKKPDGEVVCVPNDPTEHYNFTGIHYNGKDEYGGTFGDGREGPGHEGAAGGVYEEEEPMSAPFILALVNFAVFLFLLAKFGGPVARKAAEERHDQIKTALDEAAKLRKQAEDKLGDFEKRIKDVDTEIKKLVDGIRADAEADKARILAAAEAQAKQMKHDAELRIAAEIEFARAALTKEVTTAATAATEKLLRDNLQPADQEKLVSTFIGGLS